MIGIVVLILIVLFIKFEHQAKRLKLLFVVLILVFLYFSVTSVMGKAGIKFDSLENVGKAVSLYFGWLSNLAVSVWHATGEVVRTVGSAIKNVG